MPISSKNHKALELIGELAQNNPRIKIEYMATLAPSELYEWLEFMDYVWDGESWQESSS